MLNSVRNHLGDLHGIGGRSSLLRQVSVSSHDNGVPKWLGLSSTPAGCLLPCIDQVTWSHAIDDASDYFDSAGATALPQDSLLRSERGSSSFDGRFRSVSHFVWRLPLSR